MKRVLSLVLALVLVLGMIPTFAAEMTGGQHLFEHEFIAGDGNGNLNEDANLTREQLAKLILELNGSKEEAEALTLPPSFTDSAKISAWARPYVAYAQIEGLMVGFTDGSFRPQEGVTGQQLAAVLTRALGYEFEWATVIADAADLGIEVPAVAKLTRGEAFEAMWVTVNTVPDGETLPLGTLLGKLPDPTPVVVDLAVESVTALNTKQIAVVFNKAVDKVTAETATNYTVAGVAYGKAALQADGKTVIATMATDTKVVNATEVEIKVLKNVKDADGVALKADYAKKITVVDTVSPTYVSIKAVGQKTLELTFSEPVIDNNAAGAATDLLTNQFTVKSGIYTYTVQTATADFNNNKITLTLGTNLIAGPLTVKLNALGMSDVAAIRDFAGLVLVPVEFTFDYVADTTVPTATLVSVNKASKTAKVTFSKPVYGANVMMYHSVNGVAAYGTAPVNKTEPNASTEWEFIFTNALPSGNLTFFLANDAVASNQLTDLFGVKVPNQTFTYNVVADTTAPTVSELKVNTNVSFEIKFSEAIDQSEIKAANFEILKPDGTALAFTPSLKPATTDTVLLTATLADNTTYTINVKAMKDLAGNAMAAAYTGQKAVADNVNPTLTAGGVYITDAKTLYVVFSEPMNEADITNKTNYTINGQALVAADTITLISSSKVKIVKDANNMAAGQAVVVGAVRDLAGKKLTADTQFSTSQNIVADTLTFTADLIAVNKVKLKFSKELSMFDAANFTPATGQWLSVESNTVVSGKSEVVLVLDTNLAADATLSINAAAGNTKSTEGTQVTAGAVVAADKIAPSIKAVVFNSATQIIVSFDETLDSNSVALAGTNGFSVSGGTLTSALRVGNTIVLTGTGFTADTDVTYTAGNITDNSAAKNKLATATRTDALGVLTATAAATPNATATLSLSTVTETYTVGNTNLLAAGGAALAAQTVGDFTFVIGAGGAAGDQVNVAVANTGVITVSVTEAAPDNLVGVHTITIVHVPTGAVETITVTVTTGPVVVVTQ